MMGVTTEMMGTPATERVGAVLQDLQRFSVGRGNTANAERAAEERLAEADRRLAAITEELQAALSEAGWADASSDSLAPH
jgi:hypothetical protein